MSVSRQEISAAVRALGVGPGDLLIVHSSLRSFGHVDGGADAVANALVDAVWPGGSIFVPTFTYAAEPFDRAATPSRDGAITNAVRNLPGALRSDHPTHSVSGIGPAAAEVLSTHPDMHPFGQASPLWKLWQRDAKVLLIGVTHIANSMMHVAEEVLQMPYLSRTRRASRSVDGRAIELTVARPGCSEAFDVIDAPLRKRGSIRDRSAGASRLMLMRAGDVVEATIDLLRADPTTLFCSEPACDACAEGRRILRQAS